MRRVSFLYTEGSAEDDWWRAVCCEEWLYEENSLPQMIYTVCFQVIISCSITTLYGFTHQKPGVMEVEKKTEKKDRTDRAWKGLFFPGCIRMYAQTVYTIKPIKF